MRGIRKRIATISFVIILALASISSILVKTNLAYATVICVDKRNNTKVLTCSDPNAIDKNSLKTSQNPTSVIANKAANTSTNSSSLYKKANVTINGFNVIADVPTTNDEFLKGLDIKDHLNENQGMLFIFNKPGIVPFWMHGMKFPIDIIWLDSNRNVVHIEHNLQPCITDLACPSYSPEKDALYVLETTADFSQRHNVKVGTHMDFSLVC